MALLRQGSESRLSRKVCLACGYRGRALQGDQTVVAFICPSCGADLYARPPRSYAEMEGLVESTPPPILNQISRLLTSPSESQPTPRRAARPWGRLAMMAGALICLTLITAAMTLALSMM